MKSAIKMVCFDMDGTLLDSMGYWRLCNAEFILCHACDDVGMSMGLYIRIDTQAYACYFPFTSS